MANLLQRTSPFALAVLVLPVVLLLLAPDGLPLVYAVCPNPGAWGIQNSTLTSASCGANPGSNDNITISSASLTPSGTQCQISVSATFSITTTDGSGCNVDWDAACGGVVCFCCQQAAVGPVTNFTSSYSSGCGTAGSTVRIRLLDSTAVCNCAVPGGGSVVVIGTGQC